MSTRATTALPTSLSERRTGLWLTQGSRLRPHHAPEGHEEREHPHGGRQRPARDHARKAPALACRRTATRGGTAALEAGEERGGDGAVAGVEGARLQRRLAGVEDANGDVVRVGEHRGYGSQLTPANPRACQVSPAPLPWEAWRAARVPSAGARAGEARRRRAGIAVQKFKRRSLELHAWQRPGRGGALVAAGVDDDDRRPFDIPCNANEASRCRGYLHAVGTSIGEATDTQSSPNSARHCFHIASVKQQAGGV